LGSAVLSTEPSQPKKTKARRQGKQRAVGEKEEMPAAWAAKEVAFDCHGRPPRDARGFVDAANFSPKQTSTRRRRPKALTVPNCALHPSTDAAAWMALPSPFCKNAQPSDSTALETRDRKRREDIAPNKG